MKTTHTALVLNEEFQVDLEVMIYVDGADPSVGIFHDCGYVDGFKILNVDYWDESKQEYVRVEAGLAGIIVFDGLEKAIDDYLEQHGDGIVEDAFAEEAAADAAAEEAYYESLMEERRMGLR